MMRPPWRWPVGGLSILSCRPNLMIFGDILRNVLISLIMVGAFILGS
jgi:hypothetical protein